MAEGEVGGRKPRKKPATFNLDEDVRAKIRAAAERTGRSQSSVVNLVLHRSLDQYIEDPELL